MDGSQFDAWTRRGFGAAAGGLAGSLLALSAIPGAEAKKGKKKKKKCKKLNDTCNDGKKKCCCGLACREPNVVNGINGRHCCKIGGSKCDMGEECCSGNCFNDFCFCKSTGQTCANDNECCSFDCNTTCQAPA